MKKITLLPFLPIGLLAVFLFSSCMVAAPLITAGAIDQKLKELSVGMPRYSVIEHVGIPHFTMKIEKEKNAFELLGYEMGNYSYRKVGVIFLRDERFVGVSRNHYEMLSIMSELGIVEHAELWRLSENVQKSQ